MITGSHIQAQLYVLDLYGVILYLFFTSFTLTSKGAVLAWRHSGITNAPCLIRIHAVPPSPAVPR